ncbi:MAG: hypothetical protein QW244_00925 [Candidatus Pacearchaeota archaeon]
MGFQHIFVKISTLLLPILIIFLAGCIGYNPPKYVCACLATCYQTGIYEGEKWESSYEVVNNAAIGGDSIEETKNNCLKATNDACPDGEIKNLTCSPVTWKEWNKVREKARN